MRERTMIWRCAEAPHVSLLGSIHVLDGPLPTWALETHDEADLTVYEFDLAAAPSRFPEMPSGVTISSLSAPLGQALASEASRLELDQEAIDRLFPFAATVVLGLKIMPEEVSAGSGVETALFHRFPHAYGALESVEDQFRAICGAPISEQLDALDLFLSDIHNRPRRLLAAIDAWRRADVGSVWESLGFPDLERRCPQVVEALFARRHEQWATHAVNYIRQTAREGERLLIVGGCGHFLGRDSFTAELARRGFHFEQH